jgi:hypothetical protein
MPPPALSAAFPHHFSFKWARVMGSPILFWKFKDIQFNSYFSTEVVGRCEPYRALVVY